MSLDRHRDRDRLPDQLRKVLGTSGGRLAIVPRFSSISTKLSPEKRPSVSPLSATPCMRRTISVSSRLSHPVAPRVVHLLEQIQVQHHHRTEFTAFGAVGQGMGDTVLEQAAVGQVGELIEQLEMLCQLPRLPLAEISW